jgi:flagellar hook-associated protein 1 FlgK
MSLTSALHTSINALNVAQEGISISSNNVANVDTPGYIKQQTDQQAVVTGGIGQGAQITGIFAKVDGQLLKATQAQTSNLGFANSFSDLYTQAQQLFGQPDSANSLSNTLDSFFSAFQSLSNSPETASLRLSAVNQADSIANNLSDIARGLEQLRLDADRQIHTDVTAINSIIGRLQASNANITNFPENSQGRLGVIQARELDLRKLSEYVDISTVTDKDGILSVLTTGGAPLLEGAHKYSVQHVTASSINNFIDDLTMPAINVYAVQGDGSLNPDVSAQLATQGKGTGITTTLQSGAIKGLLQMRDVELPNMIAQLDNFANTFRNEVNEVHNGGASFPPQASFTGTRPVASTDEIGFSGKVMIAVVNSNGTSPSSPYEDETNLKPLTLDLSTLDSGDGAGRPTLQTIMDEINDYYGPVQNRAVVGNLRDIRLGAISDSISDAGTAQFDLELDNNSALGSTVVVNSVTVIDPNDLTQTYNPATLPSPNSYTINAGERQRTGIPITVDFSGDDNRASYTVRVNVSVTDSDGNVSTADVDYNVSDNVTGIKNNRYNAQAVSIPSVGTAQFLTAPTSTTYAHASIVNAQGLEVNPGEQGFLKIATSDGRNLGVVFNQMDSEETGLPSTATANITHKGFASYFELNNLFVRNPGGAVANSALNMAIRPDIAKDSTLLSRGELVLSNQPSDPTQAVYTYELGSGNNANAIRMAALNTKDVSFAKVGSTVPATTTTFSGYSSDLISLVSTTAVNKSDQKDAEQLGLKGLDDLFQKSAGVNSDEELARIIELQNNFSASAKIISMVQELFRTLEQAFN